MAFGSFAPAFQPMAVPAMTDTSLGAAGGGLLKAIMGMKGGAGGAGGAGGNPALLGPKGGLTDMLNGGMGNGLLSKIFPQSAPAVPIDPNTGLPVTQDVLAGAAGAPLDLAAVGGMPPASPAPMMDMGSGFSPNVLSGLW